MFRRPGLGGPSQVRLKLQQLFFSSGVRSKFKPESQSTNIKPIFLLNGGPGRGTFDLKTFGLKMPNDFSSRGSLAHFSFSLLNKSELEHSSLMLEIISHHDYNHLGSM